MSTLSSPERPWRTAPPASHWRTPTKFSTLPWASIRRLPEASREIGLDYHYAGYDREQQIILLREQLDLAKQLDLPVIIHARDATEDYIRILEEFRPRGVVHCFSGSAETAQQVLKLGMYIGFTGVLTFSNAKKARRALAVVPEDRLVLETDCPYMAPVPMRGRRCDSTMIPYTAEAAAQVLGKDMQTVLEQTCRNGERLFGIPAAEKGAEPCV